MNKWLVRGLTFLGYSLPYVFLGMNGDAKQHSMLFYGVMLVALMVLTPISTRTNNIAVLIMGNLASFVISYFLVIAYELEEWNWYFKPFSAKGLLVFVSILSWMIQIIYFLCYRFKHLRLKDKL